jgi:hypothetical protein
MLFYSCRVNYLAWPVSLAILPLSLVSSTIKPIIDAETLLFILIVAAHVASSIFPFINSFPVHHVVLPLTFVAPPVGLLVNSSSLDFALPPISLIG